MRSALVIGVCFLFLTALAQAAPSQSENLKFGGANKPSGKSITGALNEAKPAQTNNDGLRAFDLTGGAGNKKGNRVKLIFFMDDSRSMQAHHEKFKALVDRFIDRLSEKRCLQISAGVVPQSHYEYRHNQQNRGDYFAYKGFLLQKNGRFIEHKSNKKYLNLQEDMMAMTHLEARLGFAYYSPRATAEVVVDHVWATIINENKIGSFDQDKAVVAIVFTDVLIGRDRNELRNQDRIAQIRQALGPAKNFLTFGVGLDLGTKNVRCEKFDYDSLRCDAVGLEQAVEILNTDGGAKKFTQYCREQGFHSDFEADILKDFIDRTGGDFVHTCSDDYTSVVDSMVEKVLNATNCAYVM